MVYASPDQTGTPVVCGEIGGVVGEDGSLTIGLQAMDGGKASGLASFAPNRKGDGTTVSVNLIGESPDHGRADDATGDAADDAGGTGGGKHGSSEGSDGGNASNEGSNGDNASNEGSNGDSAADGTGNVAVPPDSVRTMRSTRIASLNPNIAPGGSPGTHSPTGRERDDGLSRPRQHRQRARKTG